MQGTGGGEGGCGEEVGRDVTADEVVHKLVGTAAAVIALVVLAVCYNDCHPQQQTIQRIKVTRIPHRHQHHPLTAQQNPAIEANHHNHPVKPPSRHHPAPNNLIHQTPTLALVH